MRTAVAIIAKWIGYCVLAAAIAFALVTAEDLKRDALAAPVVVGDSAIRIWSASGLGSGVHLGKGIIVTAAHVVGTETDLKIKNGNGIEGTARVLWTNKEYDVALLATDDLAAGTSKLACRDPRIGEAVEVVGNPAGLEFVHAWGRVAAPVEKRIALNKAFIADLSVAPGVSGGPVYAADGKVLGITSAVAVTQLAMFPSITGYAYIVPSSAICKLLGL